MIAVALCLLIAEPYEDVARLPPVLDAQVEATRIAALETQLAQSWAQADLTRELQPAEPCPSDACWAAARAAGLRYLVRTTVSAQGHDFAIEIEILDVVRREVVARTSEPCEVCGLEEAYEMIGRQVAVARDKLERMRGRLGKLTVISKPTGALVSVDGEVVGNTPVEQTVALGMHVVEVERAGWVPQRSTVEMVRVQQTFDVRLVRAPSRRQRAGRIVGGTLLGSGAAVLIPGVVLWGLDGRQYRRQCSGSDVDPNGDCRFLYDTRVEGISLVSIGGALVIAGAAILIVASQRRMRGGQAWRRSLRWGWLR